MKKFPHSGFLIAIGALASLSLSCIAAPDAPTGIDTQTATAGIKEPAPFNAKSFEQMGVLAAWKKYDGVLSWGKGQTLAILDDGNCSAGNAEIVQVGRHTLDDLSNERALARTSRRWRLSAASRHRSDHQRLRD